MKTLSCRPLEDADVLPVTFPRPQQSKLPYVRVPKDAKFEALLIDFRVPSGDALANRGCLELVPDARRMWIHMCVYIYIYTNIYIYIKYKQLCVYAL